MGADGSEHRGRPHRNFRRAQLLQGPSPDRGRPGRHLRGRPPFAHEQILRGRALRCRFRAGGGPGRRPRAPRPRPLRGGRRGRRGAPGPGRERDRLGHPRPCGRLLRPLGPARGGPPREPDRGHPRHNQLPFPGRPKRPRSALRVEHAHRCLPLDRGRPLRSRPLLGAVEMDFWRAHLLSIITYTPLLGAALLALFPYFRGKDEAVRWVANGVGLLGFLVSLPLWFWFDRGAPGFQFIEKWDWIPSIGVHYFFGVDGVSTLLILLTTLLGFIAILSSWNAITDRVRQYYIFLLLLQTGMLGVFCALDMFLFYVFWEVMLVPMYFLIGIWGSTRRMYAAIKFFLYTLVGSVVMLLGILALYFLSKKLPAFAATGTFDYTQWLAMGIPPHLQYSVFLAFFLRFAITIPLFPFHTWLPDAHVQAPTAAPVILAAVLLQMAPYDLVPYSSPCPPH